MKKSKYIILNLCLLCGTLLVSGCSKKTEPVSKTACYFDTVITITLYCENADDYIAECFEMANTYENMFSTTVESSDIYKLNHSNGEPMEVNPETIELLQASIAYAKDSKGAFDPTVGPLSSLWQEAIKEKSLPEKENIENALSTISYENIIIEGNTVKLLNQAQLDLGGIAKGYIADKMKEYLLSQGVTNGLINLGGNVLAVGTKSTDEPMYHIAIQKPFSEDGEPIASVKITDQSVVTSGTYQRYFKEDNTTYHHILDLENGYPCDNDLDSVTIISKKSVDGDALSTTVFLMGLKKGITYVESLEETEAIFITKDGKIHKTSGIGKDIPFQVSH